MTFPEAHAALNAGQKLRRVAWPAQFYVKLLPKSGTVPRDYIMQYDAKGHSVAWVGDSRDLLATDWDVVA